MLNNRALCTCFCIGVSLTSATIVEAQSFGDSDSAGLTPPMKASFAELQSLRSNLGDKALAVDGIIDRFKLWPAGKNLEVCFIDGNDDVRQLFADVAPRWLQGTSLTFDFGARPEF